MGIYQLYKCMHCDFIGIGYMVQKHLRDKERVTEFRSGIDYAMLPGLTEDDLGKAIADAADDLGKAIADAADDLGKAIADAAYP